MYQVGIDIGSSATKVAVIEDGKIIKVAIHTGPKGGHFYISPKTKNPVYVEKGDTGGYIIKSK